VLASMPVKLPESAEIAFTTSKIEANFSNFSAWHQRSKVLSSMWEKKELDVDKSKDEELELVKQALYVDPYDQSSWIYHRWLIGTGSNKALLLRELSMIKELSEVEPDCKWCLETLVHYNRLFVEQHLKGTGDGPQQERETLLDECRSMLERLMEIDPYRSKRYQELTDDFQLA